MEKRAPGALNAAELLAVTAPDGKPRISLRIRLPERTLTADIAAKSLRKVQTAIRDAGAQTTSRSCCKDGSLQAM